MGGKGGGYVAPYEEWISHSAANPWSKAQYEKNRANYGSEADWYAAYGGATGSPLTAGQFDKDVFTKIYGSYTPPPPPPPPPAPAAAAPAAAPAAAAPVATPAAVIAEPSGPAIGPGGAVAQPTAAGNQSTASAGDTLGGAVLKPPTYWVGGLDQTETAPKTGRGSAAIKTTTT